MQELNSGDRKGGWERGAVAHTPSRALKKTGRKRKNASIRRAYFPSRMSVEEMG